MDDKKYSFKVIGGTIGGLDDKGAPVINKVGDIVQMTGRQAYETNGKVAAVDEDAARALGEATPLAPEDQKEHDHNVLVDTIVERVESQLLGSLVPRLAAELASAITGNIGGTRDAISAIVDARIAAVDAKIAAIQQQPPAKAGSAKP